MDSCSQKMTALAYFTKKVRVGQSHSLCLFLVGLKALPWWCAVHRATENPRRHFESSVSGWMLGHLKVEFGVLLLSDRRSGRRNTVKGGDAVQLQMKEVILAPQCCPSFGFSCAIWEVFSFCGVRHKAALGLCRILLWQDTSFILLDFLNSYHCPMGSSPQLSTASPVWHIGLVFHHLHKPSLQGLLVAGL